MKCFVIGIYFTINFGKKNSNIDYDDVVILRKVISFFFSMSRSECHGT